MPCRTIEGATRQPPLSPIPTGHAPVLRADSHRTRPPAPGRLPSSSTSLGPPCIPCRHVATFAARPPPTSYAPHRAAIKVATPSPPHPFSLSLFSSAQRLPTPIPSSFECRPPEAPPPPSSFASAAPSLGRHGETLPIPLCPALCSSSIGACAATAAAPPPHRATKPSPAAAPSRVHRTR
jgi:hypothetical protein